ncbi:MAG: ribonuclease HI family protein [Caldilineaceae bacterium]|nr:ribonuclease HI family protein [Caldilineaceae bacterium]
MNRSLDRLVSLIEELSPGQRRLLWRQVKAMGLLETEELLSDRNPLPIALAVQPMNLVGHREAPNSELVEQAPPRPAERRQLSPYRSPVSGRAVMGSPRQDSEAPSEMAPLPGKAPAQPIRIVFDGGSRGNPGQGYGSFAMDWPGLPREVVQLKFGDRVTNNEAEYDTLIAALETVRDRLAEQQIDSKSAALNIWGDSLLVCNQVRGKWKCKEPRLQVRRDKALKLLRNFDSPELNHQPREKSVEILGH